MKTQYFSGDKAGQRKIAVFRLLISFVIIAVSIPGMILSKGNTLFALLYFGGLILFFYALLYFWLNAKYYLISITIHTALLLFFLFKGINAFVLLEKSGKLYVHGAEDFAWAIGSIFVAGIIAGILGIIRSRMF